MDVRKKRSRWAWPTLILVALLVHPLAVPPMAWAQTGGITGLVTDPDGHAAPPGTMVRLLRPDASTFGKASVEPGDGSFAFGGVPNGNYLLQAIPPEATPLTPSLPVPVQMVGPPVDVGTIALTDPNLVGTVYAPGGTTPTSAWIHVVRAGYRVQVSPATGGDVKIGGLPAGIYGLEAWPMADEPFWRSQRISVTVTSGVSQTISLTLSAADVYGRAVDSLGNPVKDAVTRVVDTHGTVVQRDLTSASGFFAVGGLRAGPYRLTLEPPWWLAGLVPPDPVPFAVPPRQDLGVIAFGASNKIVSGQVETHTGLPVIGALVDAHRLDKPGQVKALTGSAGRYAISLSEGLWTLNVRPVSITVPADWLYPYGPQSVHFQHDQTNEHKTVDFQVLTADSRATGVVQMPDGGVPTFTVTVGIHTDAGVGRRQAIDPGDGSFDIPVPHGSYKIDVLAGDPGYLGPPVEPIRVLPNSTYNLGILSLLERNAAISGTVTGGGGPVEDVPVIGWRPAGPGSAHSRTGPDGAYVLSVVEGTWWLKPAPGPDQPWLYAGEPAEVEVPDGGTIADVDFELTVADAEIAGVLVDEGGTPLPGIPGWVQATDQDDPVVQKGVPVVDGTFRLWVPAGTYRVSLKLPEAAPWLSAPAQDVVARSGTTTEVTLTLQTTDASIAGALWDRREEEVVSGVLANVTAFSQGAWLRTEVDPGNGAYRLEVAPGIWSLGYTVDPTSDYVALRHRRNYPVASGQTVPAPLPVAEKDVFIAGLVRDPRGDPLAGATVVADGLGGELGDLHLSTTSGRDGRFRLGVPHGHYLVRATLGPGSGWINPVSLRVFVPEGGSAAGLDLQFLAPDATLSGTVTLAGGEPVSGTVALWAFSPHDGYTKAEAELGAAYTLDVISNTVWHVGAAYQQGAELWLARARVDVPPGGATQDLELWGPFPLPAPVTVSFDASEAHYVELADGTSVYIPAGALPVSGTLTLHVTPIATFPHQRHANVYRYGYAFTATDANGQPVEARFNQDVLITFPYDEAELYRMGLSEQWLKPAYFSTTTDSWTFPESYIVDTVANIVAMQIDHFTDFALTGPAVQRVFLPLIGR